MSLMDLLVWLTGAGSLMTISWLAEYFDWFINMEAKQKKLVFFGIAVGITLASMLVINFVPVGIIEMLSPYFTAVIALFVMVFISDSFHAVTKK